jgi:hypothetical protein
LFVAALFAAVRLLSAHVLSVPNELSTNRATARVRIMVSSHCRNGVFT